MKCVVGALGCRENAPFCGALQQTARWREDICRVRMRKELPELIDCVSRIASVSVRKTTFDIMCVWRRTF